MKPDAGFLAQMGVLSAALTATETDYGVTTDQSAAVATAVSDFDTKLAAVATAKAAYETAVAEKAASRAAVEALVRPIAKAIQARAATTDDARRTAGLPIADKVRSNNAPITPTLLVAEVVGANGALLTWNSNGNTTGVRYVVEMKVGSGAWAQLDVVTATRLSLTGLAAGTRHDFRVSARRRSVTSEASSVSSIWA